ncbi:predicted protein [Sclerotinia sclerotiorum 1980 UF-70]|uniref:Uncharacterized protein n=1 Tax=Sclerotinia sclerotiorum (strain ATCC 18683 / 1980 / Ss-1) TaxID=665079 RepID=A7EQ28_SCLS1|nr:predicted protein [Sclerotinia sclerotiorum 1980 UF-70]EDO04944.1 predicted protein [Sclerotinia sclerotiorum 1980 UF-70]
MLANQVEKCHCDCGEPEYTHQGVLTYLVYVPEYNFKCEYKVSRCIAFMWVKDVTVQGGNRRLESVEVG